MTHVSPSEKVMYYARQVGSTSDATTAYRQRITAIVDSDGA